MNVIFKSTFASTLLIAATTSASTPVIYGDDSRKDIYETTNLMCKQLADSTVALMKSSAFTQNNSGIMSIKAKKLEDRIIDSFTGEKICSTENFHDQPTGAFCSGALIAQNMILTAGHCITDEDDCAMAKIVFGYEVNEKGNYPVNLEESQIYSCKSIIHREVNGKGADFGIIMLDRDVTDHNPLKLADRSSSTIDKSTKLLMIGHPSGLPTKLDNGGTVRNPTPNGFFTATTDSYGGSSGSAVFNLVTLEIEGVLVRGDKDYVEKNGCYASKQCKEDGCRGEDVTKVSSIASFIPSSSL